MNARQRRTARRAAMNALSRALLHLHRLRYPKLTLSLKGIAVQPASPGWEPPAPATVVYRGALEKLIKAKKELLDSYLFAGQKLVFSPFQRRKGADDATQ